MRSLDLGAVAGPVEHVCRLGLEAVALLAACGEPKMSGEIWQSELRGVETAT